LRAPHRPGGGRETAVVGYGEQHTELVER